MKIDPTLRGGILEEDLADLNASSNTIYAVWSDLTIAFLNDAWFDFARENRAGDDFLEGFGIGSSVDVGGDDPMNRYFIDCIHRSLREERAVAFQYECPAPETFRLMQVNFLPLRNDLCVISIARVKSSSHQAQGRDPRAGTAFDYLNDDGLISMCSCCRRVRVPGTEHEWDFVPALIEDPVDTISHTFCESCKAYWLTVRSPVQLNLSDLTREYDGTSPGSRTASG